MDCRDERHELNNMIFPASYFEDEVREGFYVPAMMKRYWAGQLKVLAEIDKICRKYSIRWFAIYGTLIGAVRHGGYIPWDDDLDICMLRSDYERFFEIAREELPDKYTVLDVRFEPEYDNMLGRIVNNKNVVDCSEEHLKEFMNCPYTIGVDVFPLDDICEDARKEEIRVERLKDIEKAVDMIHDGSIDSNAGNELLGFIEHDNKVVLKRGEGLKRELLLLSNDLYSEYTSENASHVALMPIWVKHGGNKFPKRIFEYTVFIPFENTYLPVPGMYDELLHIAYGNYMIVNRGGGIHNYPVYEEQEHILRERIGRNPYRYTFSYDELMRTMQNRINHRTTDDLCNEMAEELYKKAIQIDGLLKAGDILHIKKHFEDSQSIAISLGTMLEERISESYEVVRFLEEYCEILYECHEDVESSASFPLIDYCANIKMEVDWCLSNRKRKVLLLPCTAKWWDTMESYYVKLKKCGLFEVVVAPIPYYVISNDGSVERIDTPDVFPEDVEITSITEYDLKHRYVDEIVIQIPYDETNTVIRIPSFFYSNNLLNYTDKLTYIPYIRADSPAEGDGKAVKMLGLLVEQPAVINADSIILSSNELKNIYEDKLTAFAGEDTREYWKRIIKVLEPEIKSNSISYMRNYQNICNEVLDGVNLKKADGKKLLMYYVSISYLIQYGLDAINKMRRNLVLFDEAKDSICCLFVKEDRIKGFNTEVMKELAAKYDNLCDDIEKKDNYITVSLKDADLYVSAADAYFGSAGLLAHRCRLNGKPVMMMGDVSI